MLQLSDFDYNLPKELIAQYPLTERDAARLLVVHRSQKIIEHRIFKDIGEYLRPGDLVVLNDTKVTPSRLVGRRKSGGRVELLLLGWKNGLTFNTLIKPGRVKPGEEIFFNRDSVKATITAKNEATFTAPDVQTVYKLGVMPLPPYIKRDPEPLDTDYYQTVYARCEGAVAAPTAGLHFTGELLKALAARGVTQAYVTLHVGHATFKPVKENDILKHVMDKETFFIPENTVAQIKQTRAASGRIVAVGTTSCRALETFARGRSHGQTNLFIYPGFTFTMTDCLLTNFHLPRTTLFMLVAAFAGRELAHRTYQEAVDRRYRFYSYGDAMLIL